MRTNRIVPFAALILAVFSNVRAEPQSESAAASGEPEVETIPEIRLGDRGMVHIKQLVWKASSPWFGKGVEVRRATTALSPETRKAVLGIAKAKGWKPKPKPSPVAQPGDHRYLGRKPHNILTFNDITGEVTCIFRDALGYKRDEQSHPVLEGFPPDEKLVDQCLEWLPKLGLERKNFQQDPNGPRGMDVFLGESTIGEWNSEKKGYDDYRTTRMVSFDLMIGAFPAWWNGIGGRILFTFADGGKLAAIKFCLRGSEPLGKCRVLDRAELEQAILDGFCWTFAEEPFDLRRAEVTLVELEAYHSRSRYSYSSMKHFPLLWSLQLQDPDHPEHKITLLVPALRQHRNKYPLREPGTARAEGESPAPPDAPANP